MLQTNASRPDKLDHAQTLLYEIDMLRYCRNKLAKDEWGDRQEQWGILESFLMHFRNLIEFFGKPNPRGDDLHITKVEHFWTPKNAPQQRQLDELRQQALWEQYEGPNNPEKISRYLQHCTTQRIMPKAWEFVKMYNELAETLDKFESLLPDNRRPWAVAKIIVPAKAEAVSSTTASTFTMTSGPTLFSLPDIVRPAKKEK